MSNWEANPRVRREAQIEALTEMKAALAKLQANNDEQLHALMLMDEADFTEAMGELDVMLNQLIEIQAQEENERFAPPAGAGYLVEA